MKEIVVGSVLLHLFGVENMSNAVEPVPFIYILHGRLGKQEDYDDLAERFVKQLTGPSIAITFDLANHGKRLLQKDRNLDWMKGNLTHAIDMYSQMLDVTQTLGLLIDILPSMLSIKAASHSVVGISQGGHNVLLAMTNESRISVGISYISSGDYFMNMKLRHSKWISESSDKLSLPSFKQLYPDSFAQVVKRYDPIENLDKLAKDKRPLLIINGDEDTLVPKQCNLSMVNRLSPLYEGSGHKLVHKVLPGVKHEITEEMKQMGVDFLNLYLFGQPNKF